ncbi:energy transducer TonB [Maribacter halichondriae]|uniref:energy transducer TonB n=1 Tax=Maribacter halichondriae TaxID=2980554 RepID=UPI002359D043|nr:energy transducer TonB [Maribacter sp. Hal144]
MEPKKNPKKDVNRNRGLYFIAGLALVLLLTFVALEWKTYDKKIYDVGMNSPDTGIEEEIPPIILPNMPPPPPPPVIANEIEIIKEDDPRKETPIAITEVTPETPIVIDSIIVEEPDEDIPVPFSVIENVPVFPGCERETDKKACFNTMILKHVKKTFRYPEIAQEMGIQGKVYMNFVIQKDGSIGDIQIMRSPDKNLGEEATRIIDKLPKMIPGKQRGKAVRVPFSIPITFKLQ